MAFEQQKLTGSPVRLNAITKSYGDFRAVDRVSLDVGAGEFVSLLGPSGSGKTSLLMMIAGFERPDTGRIAIEDKDITDVAPNRRGLGIVFQKYALFPHMTIGDNVGFPLRMRKLPPAERARTVQAALDMVQLGHLRDRLPHQLSGGQQQRVAVARALVFEPPVLLMDEPLGALDKKLREQMQIEIKAIQQRLGVTVVYVTHDQEEALTMSDRVAVMSDGRLEQIGTPVDLYQSPRSPFVADFIGKMNFLDGVFAGKDGDRLAVRLAADTMLHVPNSLNGSAASLGKDAPLRIAVRPERLKIAMAGTGNGPKFGGSVDAAIFVGTHRTYMVSLDGAKGAPIQVHLPAEQASFEPGARVDVLIDGGSVNVFPAGAPA